MSSFVRHFVVVLAAIGFGDTVFADSLWSVGGPEAGNVTALASAPPSAVVYAATLDGGVWKSSDSGAHWSHAANGLPTSAGSYDSIDSLAVDPVNPAIAYVGYFAKGFYRTIDGGSSWSTAGSGISGSVEAIAVDPTAPAIVLAGGSNGVYRSSDRGATFLPAAGVAGVPVTALAIDAREPLSVLAGTDFSGLYLSFDGGLSWVKNTGTDLDSEQVRTVFFDSADDSTVVLLGIHTIYRGTKQEKSASSARSAAIVPAGSDGRPEAVAVAFILVFQPWHYYDDYGAWACEMTGFSENKGSLAVASVPIYVATEGSGIYVSTNTGSTFSPSNAGLPSLTILALADGSDAITSGSSDLGIARSTDGSHWAASNAGFVASEVQTLAVSRSAPSTVFAGTAGALYKSVDAGVSWTLLGGTVDVGGISAVAVDPGNASIVYAASGDGGVFKSTNGGSTWSPTALDSSTFVYALAIDPSSTSTIWAGATDAVHKTTDGGAHWTLANPSDSIPYVQALAIDPVQPSTVYAGTDGSGVFRTTDGGAHWANISSSQPFVNTGTVSGLAVDPSSHATLYAATSNGGWKTGNGGAAWTEINDGLEIDFERPTLRAITVSAGSPSKIDVGSTGAFGKSEGTGVYESTNGGTSWSALNTGLSNTGVQALAVSGGASPILYAGTRGGGVFRSPPAAPPPPPGKRRIIPAHPGPAKKVKPPQ